MVVNHTLHNKRAGLGEEWGGKVECSQKPNHSMTKSNVKHDLYHQFTRDE